MKVALIVNDKLSLISPKLDQATELYKLIEKNRQYLNKYITFSENKDSPNRVKLFLQEISSFNIGGQKFNLLIQFNGRIVGLIGFHKIDRLHARAEIGYWLGEDYQGKGIMREAITKFLQHGFDALAVNKVELFTLTSHDRNIRMVESVGFKKEGVLKEHYFMHGAFKDAMLYRMLKSEFLKNLV